MDELYASLSGLSHGPDVYTDQTSRRGLYNKDMEDLSVERTFAKLVCGGYRDRSKKTSLSREVCESAGLKNPIPRIENLGQIERSCGVGLRGFESRPRHHLICLLGGINPPRYGLEPLKYQNPPNPLLSSICLYPANNQMNI